MSNEESPNPRMWHLDQDPYNRAAPGEPRGYNLARHSYTPQEPHPSTSGMDQYRAYSTDALDSEKWSNRAHNNDRRWSPGSNGIREIGGGPPAVRPPRPGKRPRGTRSQGNRGGQGTPTHDDFVFLSPGRPPTTGSLAVPEEDDEDEEGTERPRERKPFIVHNNTNNKNKKEKSMGRKCRDCMTRVPYATLIATLMCCVGVGVFCGTMYRGTTLTLRLFEDVFKMNIKWVEPVQLTFMVVGAGMGGLGLMILFVGCLSTGDTRNKVYRTWRGRVGGRISCAIFMGITYLLSLAWLLMFAALIIVTLFYTLAWFQCLNVPQNECIDYNQFSFLFPAGTLEEHKRVCTGERKLFCKDYVNHAEFMFILATVSAFLVILSLVHYLMCLAANYAHIKDQEKFMDLQEIQFLHESEMSTLPKDRF